MAAYLVVDTLLDKPELYEEYKVRAAPIAQKFGGKYLARGGKLDVKESDLWTPSRLVLLEFKDAETAKLFYESTEYQEVLKISKMSARRTVTILDGV